MIDKTCGFDWPEWHILRLALDRQSSSIVTQLSLLTSLMQDLKTVALVKQNHTFGSTRFLDLSLGS